MAVRAAGARLVGGEFTLREDPRSMGMDLVVTASLAGAQGSVFIPARGGASFASDVYRATERAVSIVADELAERVDVGGSMMGATHMAALGLMSTQKLGGRGNAPG